MLYRYILPAQPMLYTGSPEKLSTCPQTLSSFKTVSDNIRKIQPDTIIVISSYGPCFGNHFYMPSQPRISGDFSAFGIKKPVYGYNNDTGLAEAIAQKARTYNLSAGFVDDRIMKQRRIPYDIDTGILVPLAHTVGASTACSVLPIATSDLGPEEHYQLGVAIREAVTETDKKIVLIANGDMCPCSDNGEAFDKQIRKLLLNEDSYGFLAINPDIINKAKPQSINAVSVLLGTLDGFDYIANILSYENSFGTGMLSVTFFQEKPRESALNIYRFQKEQLISERDDNQSYPVQLARKALEEYAVNKRELSLPKDTPEIWKNKQGGIFVTLEKNGCLRGSLGTIKATQPTMAEEIINSAICTGFKNPMFEPLTKEEIKDITITVEEISEITPVLDSGTVDPRKHGLIVSKNGKRGVVLPGTEGINTRQDLLEAAKAKAGIHPWTLKNTLSIEYFTTKKYH